MNAIDTYAYSGTRNAQLAEVFLRKMKTATAPSAKKIQPALISLVNKRENNPDHAQTNIITLRA